MLNYTVSLSDKGKLPNYEDKHFLGNEFSESILCSPYAKASDSRSARFSNIASTVTYLFLPHKKVKDINLKFSLNNAVCVSEELR